MTTTSILIIDDEINLINSLAFTLRQAGMDCIQAHDGHTGCKLAKKDAPDVVLLDVRMPGMSGLEVLEWLNLEVPDTSVIMMSAHEDTQDAVHAMKLGASDYLSKPFDVDELILLIKETSSRRQLRSEVQYLRKQNAHQAALIGNSAAVVNLRDCIDRVSESSVKTILLSGDTGVGKGVVARELHLRGSGKQAPYIEINCATLPEHLIEAELFGAEVGSILGMVSKRIGLVEIADSGTLFLDDIGEMPLSVQSKLLSFLETWNYRPIGATRKRRSDVRIIASTHGRLEDAVEKGAFRQDLYYRLKVMPIEIPPLRERDADIELLADHFAKNLATEVGSFEIGFTSTVRKMFHAYEWPGNVRELKNLIERLTILHPGRTISEEHLPAEIKRTGEREDLTIEQSLLRVERDLIQDALIKSQGRRGAAAERLGISRHAMKRRMHKLGLS